MKFKCQLYLKHVRITNLFACFYSTYHRDATRRNCGFEMGRCFEFEMEMIYIKHQLQRVDASLRLVPTKTKKSRRPISVISGYYTNFEGI